MIMLKPRLMLLLGALGALAGCGETSFVEVTVQAATNVDLSMITSCEVRVTGADKDDFNLENCGPGDHAGFGGTVGVFQYGTGSSGQLTFAVSLLNNLAPIGRGEGNVPIKSGGRATLTVTVMPATN
jgi:hypothetical protein